MQQDHLLYTLSLPEGFSLRDTLLCGQCFRWNEEDGVFTGWAGNRKASLYQRQNTLFLTDPDTTFWKNYLDLDEDYAGWNAGLRKDPTLFEAVKAAGGIRILRQDPWETLVSFIISANNNIPRIKGIIERLCAAFGENSAFPSPNRLAALSEEDLAPIRAGFRAKYILDAAKKVASGSLDLNAAKLLPDQALRDALRSVSGVGPKVAECVLLYGFHRLEAFPIDTWIKKVLAFYYPAEFPETLHPKGVAQQYLFHYIRTVPEAGSLPPLFPLSEKGRLAAGALFGEIKETMILSALEGVMGEIHGDDPDSPRCVRATLGDLAFFAGETESASARRLVETSPVPILAAGNESETSRWEKLILSVFPDAEPRTRYAIKKESDIFDRDKLRALIFSLPEGFSIQPIEGEWFNRCLKEDWSRDFVSCFSDAADYEKRGLGFLVLDSEKRPVSGASSYSVYRSGLEIEVDTKADYRRMGLAAAVCAKLILTALERGLYPSWDAANLTSVRLSERLGYHLDHPYTVWTPKNAD